MKSVAYTYDILLAKRYSLERTEQFHNDSKVHNYIKAPRKEYVDVAKNFCAGNLIWFDVNLPPLAEKTVVHTIETLF